MEEIKTSEQELRELIAESRLVLSKLKRTLNIMLVVAGIIFIPFLYSFISVQVNVSDLQKSATRLKTDIIYFQNDIQDINGFTFTYKDGVTEEQREKAYNKALRKFNGDVTRGEEE